MTTKEQKKNTHRNEKEQITYLGRGLHQSVGQQECVGSVKIHVRVTDRPCTSKAE